MDPSVSPESIAAAGGAIALVINIVGLVVGLFFIVAFWKIFTKAGKPGIAAIIPIWQTIAILQIAGKPVWWIILLWFPLFPILALIGLAKNFGKGGGFAAGLILLPVIFVPILAFGSAEYIAGNEAAAAPEAEAAPAE